MPDERCLHDLVVGQCTECAPVPRGLTARVFVTKGGSVFHRTTGCGALRDGQRKARRFGRDTHDPLQVALSVALTDGRGACIPCFPLYRPSADAKPCQVLVAGNWVPGLLTQWRRGPDHRWSGVVTYVVDGEQLTGVKDQSELRSA
ncbi:hypothetical protein [Streptomyces gilvosporeus]|uniref:Uncharacterized protein n=1 Tax=Streptomyces gilvosporeus TaxID=553510 RepID=A0A1V0TJM9_9ACTN|nr:hypothetical protein [Streptomyces gilvosporeus]ARF53080.1 hypothetical protein B1H19_01790 [Streptomyces gilvosporeus]